MPHIQIALAEGRTTEQLTALIHEVGLAVKRTVGTPQSAITIHVTEVPLTHWGNGESTLAERRAATIK